ncbi:hypothetical protein HMF7854_04025 [Sphingomonas ginkgonis]|uniref:CDP-alcohol phosphatidyltransferase family protein n=1 Tax=Sphingomonas ginkgonis TaxID=2315330 RepID=A0A429V7Z4_9SPHN|nr:hypothetical protein [Sphingomonas ginkgonis]RST30083.1 hypothetical protein HMF7854_04025 [Sphingomonas ginkgonis]
MIAGDPPLAGRLRRLRKPPDEADLTDALSRYVLARPAAWLAEDAAELGVGPGAVTAAATLLALLAAGLFWAGIFWFGLIAAFLFALLERLGRAMTLRSGEPDRVAPWLLEVVHLPLWWWGWAHGLAGSATPVEPVLLACLFWVTVAAYGMDRLVELLFRGRHGVGIDAWRPLDSRFRLIAAGRNIDLLILFVALAAGRPDLGFELVAFWSLVSLIVHGLRFAQANARADRGRKIIAWRA